MKVAVADVDRENLKATEDAVAAIVGREKVLFRECDVSDSGAVAGWADEVYATFGDVGFLLNNAGTGIGTPSALNDLKAWRTNIDVNLFGVIHVLQAFVPRMIEYRTPGTIVVTGSKQGITTPPGNLAYNVGKAGVKVVTEGLEHELRSLAVSPRLLRSHLFIPGWVNTNLAHNYFKAVKGDNFDPARDVPWSEERPAAGAWMPAQCIDYLFESIARDQFYIICPDNDVTIEMDKKRIAWATADIIERDVPLSRWQPDYQDAFEAYMRRQ